MSISNHLPCDTIYNRSNGRRIKVSVWIRSASPNHVDYEIQALAASPTGHFEPVINRNEGKFSFGNVNELSHQGKVKRGLFLERFRYWIESGVLSAGEITEAVNNAFYACNPSRIVTDDIQCALLHGFDSNKQSKTITKIELGGYQPNDSGKPGKPPGEE